VTVPNVLNQRAVTSYWQNIDSNFFPQFLAPTSAACGVQNAAGGSTLSNCSQSFNGYQFYTAAMGGYNLSTMLNNAAGCGTCSFTKAGAISATGPITLNSIYGKPLYHQTSRNLFMTVKFVF
jgi:hypothetical protein